PGKATSGKPLRIALLDDAGAGARPLLLALDATGQLIVRSADGSFSRVLLHGPYGDAAYDVPRELVWLRGDTKLDVLDLPEPAPVARTLVQADDNVLEKLGEHMTEPPTWTMDTYVNIMLDTPCHNGAGLRLDWSKGGVSTNYGAESVHVVDKPWF